MFNYGVSIDPNYPLFYYNIACVYGGKDDVENTISYLQKAFANKAHVIPGETMPDPRMDDSFARLIKNNGFIRAVTSTHAVWAVAKVSCRQLIGTYPM